MLEHLNIDGYRSCRRVSIDFTSPVTVLLGPNASGKTNVLRSLEWLARSASSEGKVSLSLRDFCEGEQASWQLRFQAGEHFYHYTCKVFVKLLANPNDVYYVTKLKEHILDILLWEDMEYSDKHNQSTQLCLFHREPDEVRLDAVDDDCVTTHALGKRTAALPFLMGVLPEDESARDFLNTAHDFFASIRYEPLDEPVVTRESSRVDGEEYLNWLVSDGEESPGGSRFPVVKTLLRLWLEDSDRFDELASLTGPNGLNLFDKIEIERSEDHERDLRRQQLYIDFFPSRGSGKGRAYQQLSLGTRRVLRLLTSLLSGQHSVLLLEHPEDSIHPGLLAKIISLLRTYAGPTQIIMTSHSPEVMNLMRPEEIRLVSMENEWTAVRPLSEQEKMAAGHFLKDEGAMNEFVELVTED